MYRRGGGGGGGALLAVESTKEGPPDELFGLSELDSPSLSSSSAPDDSPRQSESEDAAPVDLTLDLRINRSSSNSSTNALGNIPGRPSPSTMTPTHQSSFTARSTLTISPFSRLSSDGSVALNANLATNLVDGEEDGFGVEAFDGGSERKVDGGSDRKVGEDGDVCERAKRGRAVGEE